MADQLRLMTRIREEEDWVICEARMCEVQWTTGAAGVVIGCELLTVSDLALVLPCFIVLLAPQNTIVVYLWEFDAH